MSQTNFNKMCRICGELLKDRFEALHDHEERIYKYLPIKDSDNCFPKNLCLDCVSAIVSWNAFYKRCEETQKKFAMLSKQKKLIYAPESKNDKPLLSSKETTKLLPVTDGSKETIKPNELDISCNFCNIRIENQDKLNDHLIAAHCDLVFCCDLCKNYKPRDDLITHMTEHALSSLQSPITTKSKTTDKYQCPVCPKTFVTNSGLKHHMNASHITEKQFPCDVCENIFTCKRVLLNHVRSVHSQEKSFKCNKCGKSFKTDSTLYAHSKTHSKASQYKCFECGKGFNFKHHLTVHSMQHKKIEKTFECNCCNKKFTALNNLTKHRKIHDKTVDFVCHICGVKTIQKRYLRDHMKRVHQTRLGSLDTAL